MTTIRAVTFDFFQTLVHHRGNVGGRGKALTAYLISEGFEPGPWRHEVLYRVLEPHARECSPNDSSERKHSYYAELARRVFESLAVRYGPDDPVRHGSRIWEILGPRSLAVFPDVMSTLEELRIRGYRLAVISNWQCGLAHFCTELGIRPFFDEVLASAELGFEKPAREIFVEAASRLQLPSERILHVGDSVVDDFQGARAAGMRSVLVDREARDGSDEVISDLGSLLLFLKPGGGPAHGKPWEP